MTDAVTPAQAPTAPVAPVAPVVPATPLTLDTAPVVPTASVAPTSEQSANSEIVYEPTGDAGLDMALGFIGKQGLAGDHPAVVAASNGDFTLLKATLAQKGVAGYEAFIELGQQAYARTQSKAEATQAATRVAVHEAVGGEAQWATVQAWASANATPEEKAAINSQLAAGGLAAKMAAVYLAGAYGRATNTEQDPAPVTKLTAGQRPSAPSNGKLTAADYAREVAALSVKLRGHIDGHPEYLALQRRRAASR